MPFSNPASLTFIQRIDDVDGGNASSDFDDIDGGRALMFFFQGVVDGGTSNEGFLVAAEE
jgi:hypothetical protein